MSEADGSVTRPPDPRNSAIWNARTELHQLYPVPTGEEHLPSGAESIIIKRVKSVKKIKSVNST